MSKSEIETLKESVEREAELHPVELDAVKHVETDDSDAGITLRVLETDAADESDQIGFQITKPDTQMGRQVFSERLGSGFRALTDHLRDNGSDDDSDSERQGSTDEDNFDPEPETQSVPEESQMTHDDAETGERMANPPHREVGEFSITTTVDDESLERLMEELDNTFEEITDEFVDEAQVNGNTDAIEDLDERLSAVEEKLAMLGSVGG